MEETLEALQLYLQNELQGGLIGTKPKDTTIVRNISILTDSEAGLILKAYMLPAIIISPIGERDIMGPVGLTKSRYLGIKLRIVMKSISTKKLRTEGTNTVYSISDRIRLLLHKNKKLGGVAFEMRPKYIVKDLKVIYGGKSGHFVARDIFIEYTKLEAYTGYQNNQSSLNLPQGIQF